jgi:hypothetical protein
MADLCTLEAVKGYAGVRSSGDDAAIANVIAAVSALIAGHIGHDYEGDTITAETHRPPFSGAVVLRKPAASVSAVRVRGTALAGSTYRLRDDRLLDRLQSSEPIAWSSGQRIEVDYVTASDVPADLALAAAEISAFVWKQTGEDTGGARLGLSAQANADTGSADYFAQAIKQLPVARMALRNHRAFA